MDNLECQKDELSALQSIYTEDEFQSFEEEGYVGGKFLSVIELRSPFVVTYKEFKDGTVVDKEIEIEFLPPIVLQFSLPNDYPSAAPPSFTLYCTWLNRKMLSQLCKKLDELWYDNKGMEILFLWIQFLKEESLSFLNINGKLDVSKSHFRHLDYLANCDMMLKLDTKDNTSDIVPQESIKLMGVQSNVNASLCTIGSLQDTDYPLKSNLRSSNQEIFVKCNDFNSRTGQSSMLESECQRKVSSNKVVLDPRAVMEVNLATSVVTLLKEYNEKQKKLLFNKKFINCEICFQQKLGRHCAVFDTCGHIFCKDCITEYFEVQIKDGNVRSLNCPEIKCSMQALPSMVKELVSPEIFAKYDSVLLTSTLDTMTDIAYCPRSFCQYPVTIDPREKMAHCPGCEYNFCIYCRMVYHGVEPCRFRSREQRKVVEEYQNADDDGRVLLEKRYGKKQLQILLETCLSESWIMDNSQHCPTCNIAIEKSQGCNKMVCWKCNTMFCWLCRAKLGRTDPYLHFRNPSSSCYNLLFQGIVEDDDNDDWIAEYLPFL